MNNRYTQSTSFVLFTFQLAWRCVVEDYQNRQISSEQCLQSALYRHLKNSLPNAFSVFSEAVIHLSDNYVLENNKSKVVVDLLICEDSTIVAAEELKYTPRIEPNRANIRKDLTSLSHITNRRQHGDRVRIEMPRFRQTDGDSLKLQISKQRKLIFAAFCMQEATALCEGQFWKNFYPTTGYWSGASAVPPNLRVALAHTDNSGKAAPQFFGPAFERIKTATLPDGDA